MLKQGYYYYHQLKLLKRFVFTEIKLKIKNAALITTESNRSTKIIPGNNN